MARSSSHDDSDGERQCACAATCCDRSGDDEPLKPIEEIPKAAMKTTALAALRRRGVSHVACRV